MLRIVRVKKRFIRTFLSDAFVVITFESVVTGLSEVEKRDEAIAVTLSEISICGGDVDAWKLKGLVARVPNQK